jgi:hypothetical protein
LLHGVPRLIEHQPQTGRAAFRWNIHRNGGPHTAGRLISRPRRVYASFVTQAANPEDIALIVSLPPGFDLRMELNAMETNLLDARYVRRHYQFDVRVVREGRPEYHEVVAFFEQVKGRPDLKKGLLRLIP